jgi:hypothetical protein
MSAELRGICPTTGGTGGGRRSRWRMTAEADAMRVSFQNTLAARKRNHSGMVNVRNCRQICNVVASQLAHSAPLRGVGGDRQASAAHRCRTPCLGKQ